VKTTSALSARSYSFHVDRLLFLTFVLSTLGPKAQSNSGPRVGVPIRNQFAITTFVTLVVNLRDLGGTPLYVEGIVNLHASTQGAYRTTKTLPKQMSPALNFSNRIESAPFLCPGRIFETQQKKAASAAAFSL